MKAIDRKWSLRRRHKYKHPIHSLFSNQAKEIAMKFFLDTANLDEIRQGAALGLADGVTTNPSLIAKEGGVDFKKHIAAICEIVKGPVSAECTSEDTEGMLREG